MSPPLPHLHLPQGEDLYHTMGGRTCWGACGSLFQEPPSARSLLQGGIYFLMNSSEFCPVFCLFTPSCSHILEFDNELCWFRTLGLPGETVTGGTPARPDSLSVTALTCWQAPSAVGWHSPVPQPGKSKPWLPFTGNLLPPVSSLLPFSPHISSPQTHLFPTYP